MMRPGRQNTASPELPLFLHWEKFLCWLLRKTCKFPKNVRFTFTVRIENLALEVMEDIVAARYTRRRRVHLERISVNLDKLRVLLRICHELGYLDHRAYERAMRLIDEAGRMTGGWLRYQTRSFQEGGYERHPRADHRAGRERVGGGDPPAGGEVVIGDAGGGAHR